MQNLTEKKYPEYRKSPYKPIMMIMVIARHCPKHSGYTNSFNLYYVPVREVFIVYCSHFTDEK